MRATPVRKLNLQQCPFDIRRAIYLSGRHEREQDSQNFFCIIKEALIHSSVNDQRTKKVKCDFTISFIFNGLIAIRIWQHILALRKL